MRYGRAIVPGAKKSSSKKARPTTAGKKRVLARVEGTVRFGTRTSKFAATVWPPVREATGDYTCRVQMSLRRPIDTKIVGATATQAKELALAFVQSLLPQAIFP